MSTACSQLKDVVKLCRPVWSAGLLGITSELAVVTCQRMTCADDVIVHAQDVCYVLQQASTLSNASNGTTGRGSSAMDLS